MTQPRRAPLTADRLREILDYDQYTGLFRWKEPRQKIVVGSIAGSVNQGRLLIAIDQRRYKAHRLAWLYVNGVWPANEIDHRDGDLLNNRFANLRDVPHQVNQENRRRHNKNNTSKFLGVTTQPQGNYSARLHINGRKSPICLGRFSTPEEAHAAYVEAKRELHPGCTI